MKGYLRDIMGVFRTAVVVVVQTIVEAEPE